MRTRPLLSDEAELAGIRPGSSYPMPVDYEPFAEWAKWRIEPARAVLLIHDMQEYFLRVLPADASPRTELVRNIVALKSACERSGVPVLWTAQPGRVSEQDRGLLASFWGPGMQTTDADRAIISELAPGPAGTVLTKWRYSAFYRTPLLDLLRGMNRDELIVCGVFAHVGCLATAIDAFSHDVRPFLIGDAVADFSEREHTTALWLAARTCARVLATSDAVDQLRQQDRVSEPIA